MTVSKPVFAAAAVFALVLAVAPVYHIGLLAHAGTDALMALGLLLLMRAGQVSLGHAAFAGVGAYTAAILSLKFGINPWLALFAAPVAAAIVAFPIGLITLRLHGTFLPIATLAMGVSINVIFSASDITGGASGLPGIPHLSIMGLHLSDRAIAFLIWGVVLVAALALSKFMKSRLGRAIRTFEDHQSVAVTFGINVSRVNLKVLLLSACFAGLAGALYVFHTRFVSPAPFGLHASLTILIMVTLGGTAHPFGAVIGALAVTTVNMILQSTLSGFINQVGPIEPIVFGALLVILLIKWPGGLSTLLAPYLKKSPNVDPAEFGRGKAQSVEASQAAVAKDEVLLSMVDVGKKFDGLEALKNISIDVLAGRVTGLIGPNGAGKSTAFNLLSGLMPPSSGEILLNGKALPKRTEDVVKAGLSRTFQHVKLISDMSVVDNVALGCFCKSSAGLVAGLTGLDRLEEQDVKRKAYLALDRVGLTDVAHVDAGALPLGKQRLVEIARSLVAAPSVLLLDEPAAGLRAAEKENLIDMIKKLAQQGVTVLLVEHDMSLIAKCADRLYVLDRGQMLTSGVPADVLNDAAVRTAYLGKS